MRLGHQGGLGHGEHIFSVRFIGNVGYVVTFRQVDPLYVTRPVAAVGSGGTRGAEEGCRYSAYLHPLGLRLTARASGRSRPRKVACWEHRIRRSTFRTPPPGAAAPRDARQGLVGSRIGSPRVPYWPRATLGGASCPGMVTGPKGEESSFSRRRCVRARRGTALEIEGSDHHPGSDGIRRSLVVGDGADAVSETGLKGSSLGALTRLSWDARSSSARCESIRDFPHHVDGEDSGAGADPARGQLDHLGQIGVRTGLELDVRISSTYELVGQRKCL